MHPTPPPTSRTSRPGRTKRGRARIFLSYGQRDGQKVAERLRDSLAGRFDVWQDKRRIRLARLYDAEIEDALRGSQAVVFLMTPHAVRESPTADDGKDSVCRDELSFAREHDVPIIPVRVSPCDTPLLIHRLQQIDFRQWSESKSAYEAGVKGIAGTIVNVLRDGRMPERTWFGLPTPFDFEPLLRAKLRQFTGRQWLFDEIDRWLEAGRGNALLVVGDPGSGKSAAAAALVRDNPKGRLLGYHFCDYSTPETTDAVVLVQSLIAQLAARLDGFRAMIADPEIGRVLAKVAADPASVFETVVLGLLGKLPAPKDGVRYLIIDALDEALGGNRTPSIVEVLSARIDRLPAWLKLVATSRRDPPVLEQLRGLRALPLDAQDPRNRDDLKRFIENRLRDPAIRPQVGRSERARRTTAKRLLDASEGNFLAVATALEAVRLELITLAEAEGLSPDLESRYQIFFKRMFPDPRADYRIAVPVLEVIVAAQEPLQRGELLAASGLDEMSVSDTLRRLSAFLPGHDGRFRMVHKTLGDWLTGLSEGHAKAGRYEASLPKGQQRLADWCWTQYLRGPRSCPEYCLRYLGAHLAQVGRLADLGRVLFDLEWIRAKVETGGVGSLVTECALLGTESSRRLALCLRAAAVTEERLGDAIAEQLLARLPAQGYPDLESLREQAARSVTPLGFRSRFPTLTMTGMLAALEKPPVGLSRLALSEEGRTIIGLTGDGRGCAWDANSGKARTMPPGSVVVGPVAKKPKPALQRRVETLAELGESKLMTCNADGTKVVGAWSDGTICVYDTRVPERVRKTRAHGYAPELLAFLDEDRFASHVRLFARGEEYGESKVWDFTSLGSLPGFAAHLDWVRAVSIAPNSARVATVSVDRTLLVWDVQSGSIVGAATVTESSVGGVAISPDGRSILTGDRQHRLRLWDELAKHVRSWIPQRRTAAAASPDDPGVENVFCINAVAFTSDASRAIIAADGLHDVDVRAAAARVTSVPATARLIGETGTAICTRFEPASTELYALAVAPDGSIVVGAGGPLHHTNRSHEDDLRVWDLRTRRLLFPLRGHEGAVTGVAMAQADDGLRTLSSSADGTVISWSLRTRKPRHVLRGHAGVVRGVTVTPNGRYAASAGTDRTLRLWDLRAGKEFARFTGDAGFSACAFSPDGRHLVAGDMSGHVHFFEPLLPA